MTQRVVFLFLENCINEILRYKYNEIYAVLFQFLIEGLLLKVFFKIK